MDSLEVLLTHPYPQFPYLEHQLWNRGCRLLRLYDDCLNPNPHPSFRSVRAVIGDTHVALDKSLIDALPCLEIVAAFSVGVDNVDLAECERRGVRVTNTPGVLTDDVADLAVGLAVAVLRKVAEKDGFVRSGAWKKGRFGLTTKV